MRVTFNTYSDILIPQLNSSGTQTAKLQQQISSGQKITEASDDPAKAQEVLSLQTQGAQLQQYYSNTSHALEIAQATSSALGSLNDVASRASQIALQGNSITSNESFDSYGAEVSGLIEQAISAANQQYNGSYLLGGTQTDVAPFVANRDSGGAVTSVSYVGASSGASIQVGPNTSISPYTGGATNGSFAGFINQLVALHSALQNHDAATVASVGASISTAEDDLINLTGGNGAVQSRLQAIQTSLTNNYTDVSTRISSINDVDIAQASVQLTKSQTAYQAAIQTAAKVMSHSLLDYLQ